MTIVIILRLFIILMGIIIILWLLKWLIYSSLDFEHLSFWKTEKLFHWNTNVKFWNWNSYWSILSLTNNPKLEFIKLMFHQMNQKFLNLPLLKILFVSKSRSIESNLGLIWLILNVVYILHENFNKKNFNKKLIFK